MPAPVGTTAVNYLEIISLCDNLKDCCTWPVGKDALINYLEISMSDLLNEAWGHSDDIKSLTLFSCSESNHNITLASVFRLLHEN